ncbi:MAG TPA: bifunctional demethylmenaquinone methyltransferase/2-methoxy-6-polyprenyl-1,4-benzoquinol methylase UbiE [Pirellulales bacterium]|nr:bifunctional demethylmenaquinone methyltransferase/2-methoxy-6-polyprenyl-1,4-benzoquinol methylase UbiE [Pirellulales bacterium]
MPVDKSEARVRRMFGDIAARYDLLNHLLSLNLDKYWRWRTVRDVPPRGGEPVLDLCTGTGDLALAYARATDGQTPVVAADFCHPMLVVGRAKSARAGINGAVRFVEADAQHLPLPDDYFQIVSVAFGLRNVTDTDRGLAEMVRVCRPGGRVAVLEFSKPGGPLKAMYQWYFKFVLPWIGQRISGSADDAYHYLPQSVGEFPCGQALADRMTAAGLADVWRRPMTLGVATLYVGTKPVGSAPGGER